MVRIQGPDRRTFPRWLVLAAGVLVLWLGVAGTPALAGEFDREAFDAAVHHAETYYWFGMAERGNMDAYARGRRHLAEAEALLKGAALPNAQRAVEQARIDALRADLDEQATIGHDTLYGVFPLFRFFTPSLFADQTNLATFELLDEPTVMATTAASKQLAWVALVRWTPRAQLDAMFVSLPRDEALENEALYVFNANPKFFVHNQREVIDALTPKQREVLFSGELTRDIGDALLDSFDIPELLVVLVRGVDVVDGDTFSIVEGRLIDREDPLPRHRFQVMGFSRDRRMWFRPLLLTTLLLLALAYAAFIVLLRARRKAGVRVSTATYLVVPALAFLVGRATPWAISPALRSFAPAPENLAIVSFWAPLTAALLIVTLPMVVYWIVASRLSRFFPALTFEGRGAAACVGIGAGVVAYLAVPAFLYLEAGATAMLLVLTPAIGGIAYLLGRALDPAERLHGGFAVLAGFLSMAVVGAFLHASLPWLLGATALVYVALGSLAWAGRSSRAEARLVGDLEGDGPRVDSPRAVSDADFADRAASPVFQSTAAFESVWARLAPFRKGQAQRLGVVGGPGSGLSRALGELAARLQDELGERGPEPLVLSGRGREAGGRAAPYGPFREALAPYFEVDLLVSEGGQERIDHSIGGMLESLVPFGSLLFPDTSGVASESTQQNLFASILWLLRRKASQQPVLLVLDNLQAFDAASTALLGYLVRHVHVGEDLPLLLLVGSHDPARLEATGFNRTQDVIRLPYPTPEEQAAILVSGVGLSPSTADEVLERVGGASESTRGLTWLLRVVGELGRASAYQPGPDGWCLPSGHLPEGFELPREMGDVVATILERSPAHRHTLAAAACAAVGRDFHVDTLARVLDLTRLELLERLDGIERDTGIVRDVGERDDVYAFASSFMLDAVRQQLRVSAAGPDDTSVPQIVREYHARLAAALVERLATDPHVLYRVADHYYAAGVRHAQPAVQYALLAARAHAAIADFDGCDQDLDRAATCAAVAGLETEVDDLRRAIRAQRVQMEGDREALLVSARESAAYLRANPAATHEVRLALGQLVYEAGKRQAEASLLEDAVAIGRGIIADATTPVEDAAGRHLVAVSLPAAAGDERTQLLEEALSLLEGCDADGAPSSGGPEVLRLLGRVLGSLAEVHLQGDAAGHARARQLLERRLELIASSRVGDLRGLAMTHGALGRLALFGEPPDPALARTHFAQDLEISEAIGDRAGQVQMHSLLGACALETGDLEGAGRHYRASWDLGEGVRARVFSGAGLLRVAVAAGDEDGVDRVAADVVELLPDDVSGVPREAREALERAIADVGDAHASAAVDTLRARL